MGVIDAALGSSTLHINVSDSAIPFKLSCKGFDSLPGELLLTGPGYEDRFLSVRPGRNQGLICWSIEGRFPGARRIKFDPPDATVKLDSELVPITDGEILKIPYGSHHLVASREGLIPHEEPVNITSGDTGMVDLTLEREIQIIKVDDATGQRIHSVELSRSLGPHSVFVSEPGYKDTTVRINVSETGKSQWIVPLHAITPGQDTTQKTE
jgi:hypothetical protein